MRSICNDLWHADEYVTPTWLSPWWLLLKNAECLWVKDMMFLFDLVTIYKPDIINMTLVGEGSNWLFLPWTWYSLPQQRRGCAKKNWAEFVNSNDFCTCSPGLFCQVLLMQKRDLSTGRSRIGPFCCKPKLYINVLFLYLERAEVILF